MTDKSVTSQKSGGHDEHGRGSGCSTVAPSVHGSSAKSVYKYVRLFICMSAVLNNKRNKTIATNSKII